MSNHRMSFGLRGQIWWWLYQMVFNKGYGWKPMSKLPVARIMYRHKPNFNIGTSAWCYAGGAHHSVVSTALTRDDIAMFARLTGTELITIGDDTTEADSQKFFMK